MHQNPKLFFPEEMPDLIAEEACTLWSARHRQKTYASEWIEGGTELAFVGD